ncbi:MAG: LacI family DNA-binding transcriptional regulator [Candidatus Nanopelagicales bacterium]
MGDERPTLDTVARAAGVSRMTVSNAYNRPDQLSPATRERVLAAAEQLGYAGPDPAARSLRRRSSGTIGVLLTDRLSNAFSDPGLVSLLRGLADELGAAGQSMLLVPSEAEAVGDLVRGSLVDAFVVCSMAESDEAVQAVLQRRLPLVTVGHPRLSGVPLVGIDNGRAASRAADHLLELGHRRIAILGLPGRDPGDTQSTDVPVRWGVRDRADAVRRTVEAVPRTRVTQRDAAVNTHEEGVRLATELLDVPASARPTALFAVTDVLALAAYEAARDLGLAIPDDLSVVGFDDIEQAHRASPALTTISQDLQGKGRIAARTVLDLVAGEKPRTPRLSAELVVRDSTAPPPRKAGS